MVRDIRSTRKASTESFGKDAEEIGSEGKDAERKDRRPENEVIPGSNKDIRVKYPCSDGADDLIRRAECCSEKRSVGEDAEKLLSRGLVFPKIKSHRLNYGETDGGVLVGV